MNDRNTEDTTFRSREISHTEWLQYIISKDYLKPGNLCLIQDIHHHDQITPESDLSFSGRLVWVTGTWFLHLLLMIKNGTLWISLSATNKLWLKIPQMNRFDIFEKRKVM